LPTVVPDGVWTAILLKAPLSSTCGAQKQIPIYTYDWQFGPYIGVFRDGADASWLDTVSA